MKTKHLLKFGYTSPASLEEARRVTREAAQRNLPARQVKRTLAEIQLDPAPYADDPLWGSLARLVAREHKETAAAKSGASAGPLPRAGRTPKNAAARAAARPRVEAVPYRQWGTDIDRAAVEQMDNACLLPVSVAGALMPDAHVGYGLPIGGVLATENAVIPYAVGVDIACRMKMTVLDLPPDEALAERRDRLKSALTRETQFGVGASFRQRKQHDVLDEDWTFSRVAAELKDRAWAQLGTSGSGNHFVEFGVLRLDQAELGLEPGRYLALLSHSGSRGAGAGIASHYSRLAQSLHPDLPGTLRHLAWLDLDSEAGQEYWRAMELMGNYAAANHALIHEAVARNLGAQVLAGIENHHNFAWKERHGGRDLIVHRKGATPAGAGVLGIIPGSMADPAFIVRGRGVADSLDSAAHGAGRRMSRKAAKQQFRWPDVKQHLKEREVELISAGIDEVPMAYKNILEVMAAQSDLVETVARFDPRMVKMAPAGERPED